MAGEEVLSVEPLAPVDPGVTAPTINVVLPNAPMPQVGL